MKLKPALTPFRVAEPGPYWRKDLRARSRRALEGWMPLALHIQVRRLQLAIGHRERLRAVPKAALPLHSAWMTQADMDWANKVARELEAEGGGS